MVNYLNLLRLLGFEIATVSRTSDDSTIVRIKNSDCYLDFYDSGDVVVVYSVGDVKHYHEFAAGDFEEIKELIKSKFK
jgi:hypothetical protein